MTFTPYPIEAGTPQPLGATVRPNGVNFSVFSEHATGVELLLFAGDADPYPFQVITLDPDLNQRYAFWHVFVQGLKPGVFYAYRVDGPNIPKEGLRFNRNQVLIDPYAKAVSKTLWNPDRARTGEDNLAHSMRGLVVDPNGYDWEGDQPLRTRMEDTVIYEMHVRGFTQSPSSQVRYPGTFKGIIEKIPYLKDLGINALELLPVFAFDEQDILRTAPDGRPLTNYWGYNPIGFFAPHGEFGVSPSVADHVNEFRDMVKALHRAGIQVFLDVVFNHTGEGDLTGPVISFKGFDNSVYYYLKEEDKRLYRDFTGCGNTFNCNHPIGEKMIKESLTYWVEHLHVDGFRFDLASVLSRGADGEPLPYPPVLWDLELMDSLADTKLIAEAWDAAGLYQVGDFPGYRWADWNGKYRDDIRHFVRGEPGLLCQVASRITGSSDVYQRPGQRPTNGINFITCHDGFTMMDLVSYRVKHNLANGEENRDGYDYNHSCNNGVEGKTDDPLIQALRIRQMKNFAGILLMSQGVPMLLSGDEVGRTQRGNNNPYCQDNEISWFDWAMVGKNQELLRFFSMMIRFRLGHTQLRRSKFFTGADINERGLADIVWHGTGLNAPGWSDREARVLSFTIGSFNRSEPDIHVILNMDSVVQEFELPPVPGRRWHRFADTALPSPQDIGADEPVKGDSYRADLFSIVVLISK